MMLNVRIPLRGASLIAGAWLMALAAAACGGDGPTDPVQTAGSLSFTYSGAESGSFAVTGVRGPASDGASGVRLSGPPNLLIVGAVRATSGTQQDFFEMWLSDVAAQTTISLGQPECFSTVTDCPFVVFGRNMPKELPDLGTEVEGYYVFRVGTVTVTTVNENRIAGTFQGTAASLTLQDTPRVIEITNGKFDVPVMSLDDLN
jgi:hypothetical protein